MTTMPPLVEALPEAVTRHLAGVSAIWQLGPWRRVTPLAGNNNETFLLDSESATEGAGEGAVVARRVRASKSLDEVRFELALIAHAAAHGVPTAPFVPTPHGEPWADIEGRLWTLSRFVRHDDTPATAERCAQAGEVLGRLHVAITSFRPPTAAPRDLKYKDGREHLASIDRATLTPAQAELHARATELSRELSRRPHNAVAVIHGGCRRSNLLFRDGRPAALLDFDSAREDDPALDVAIALWSFARPKKGCEEVLAPERMIPFARGFARSCPTDEAFAQALPVRLAETILHQGAAALREAAGGGEAAPVLWKRAVTRVDAAARCLRQADDLAESWRAAAR
jgi:Ser/Thr protein kinase RdoA (MazF antagonist)